MNNQQRQVYTDLCYYLNCNSISEIGTHLVFDYPYQETRTALTHTDHLQSLSLIIAIKKQNAQTIRELKDKKEQSSNKVKSLLDSIMDFRIHLKSAQTISAQE